MTSHLVTALIDSDYSKPLAVGREVIQIEGRALIDLAACLDETFVEATDLLVETKQRVTVSGMGKSAKEQHGVRAS